MEETQPTAVAGHTGIPLIGSRCTISADIPIVLIAVEFIVNVVTASQIDRVPGVRHIVPGFDLVHHLLTSVSPVRCICRRIVCARFYDHCKFYRPLSTRYTLQHPPVGPGSGGIGVGQIACRTVIPVTAGKHICQVIAVVFVITHQGPAAVVRGHVAIDLEGCKGATAIRIDGILSVSTGQPFVQNIPAGGSPDGPILLTYQQMGPVVPVVIPADRTADVSAMVVTGCSSSVKVVIITHVEARQMSNIARVIGIPVIMPRCRTATDI